MTPLNKIAIASEKTDSSSETSNSLFTKRHLQQLIHAMRQPKSGVDAWLADAMVLLIENVEYFPPPTDEGTYVVEYIYPH